MSRRTVTSLPRNEPGLVDEFIGSAYDVVKGVYDNLEIIQGVYDQIEEIPTMAQEAVDAAMVPVRIELDASVTAAANSALDAEEVAAEFAASTSVTPTASKIPKADANGKLDVGWFAGLFVTLTQLATSTGASLIGYAHSYVGAVTRSMSDRFKTVVDVMDFGVVAGPVSYAQAELNLAAINKASAYAVSVGAGILQYPGKDIWVRRITGNDGTNAEEAAIVFRSNLLHRGKGKKLTRIVRAGPTTVLSMNTVDQVSNAGIKGMTIDGNPGIVNYTHYQANMCYMYEATDMRVEDVLFLNTPGLHALDINAVDGLIVYNVDFLGYDLSLRGDDTTYYPESIQIGMNIPPTRISKRIRISKCTAGPSADYQAPLVCVGNHTGGGGGPANSVEDIVIKDFIGNGIVNFMFRPKAWKGVKLIRNRLESGTARFCYLDFKPAYPDVGTLIAANTDVLLQENYHNGDGEYIYTNVMSAVADPGTRHRNIRVEGGEVVGRPATNGISFYHTDGFSVTRLKSRNCRRHLAAYWCANGSVINPDWDGAEVNGLEVTDYSGYGVGLGLNKNLTIQGGRITNSKTYGIYVGAQNGYLIDGVDMSGSANLTGTQDAIRLFSGCKNGLVRDVTAQDIGAAFIPTYGVYITSGDNNVVENCAIPSTNLGVWNAGTLNSYEVRRTIYRTSPPTTGTWRPGTICRNTAPSLNAVREWIYLGGVWVSAHLVAGPLSPGAYTLSTLPDVTANVNALITVTNATGGRKVCQSDNVTWKILNTTTTVS